MKELTKKTFLCMTLMFNVPVLLYTTFRKSVLIELYRILHWVAPSCCPGGYLSYHFQQCFYHPYHFHNRYMIYVFFIGGAPRFPLRPSHSRSKRQRSGSLQRRSKKVKAIFLISNSNKLDKSSCIINNHPSCLQNVLHCQ